MVSLSVISHICDQEFGSKNQKYSGCLWCLFVCVSDIDDQKYSDYCCVCQLYMPEIFGLKNQKYSGCLWCLFVCVSYICQKYSGRKTRNIRVVCGVCLTRNIRVVCGICLCVLVIQTTRNIRVIIVCVLVYNKLYMTRNIQVEKQKYSACLW